MTATFPIQFIGGSRDGVVIEATAAPEHYEVIVVGDLVEIYERQNNEPPFIYMQIGYAGQHRAPSAGDWFFVISLAVLMLLILTGHIAGAVMIVRKVVQWL